MNWKMVHSIQVGLGGAIALDQYLAGAEPSWAPALRVIAGVLGVALTALGVFSQSAKPAGAP